MKQNNELGFTLIEIILAVSILATIGILTINILSTQISTREKVTEQNIAHHSINMAMQRIFDDIQGAYISNPKYTISLNVAGRQVAPRFFYRFEEFIVSIQNHRSYLANSNESNLAVVRYFIKSHPRLAGRRQLFRVVDTDMASPISNKGVGLQTLLVPELKNFSLEFWDGRQFRKEWDSSANDTQNKIPKMVKIQLETYIPENSLDKQLNALNPATQPKPQTIKLDTIAYILSSTSMQEVQKSSGEYTWQ